MNTLQKAPFLRLQRQFPNDELRPLANEMDHAYIDIAQKVNQRIIGNYPVNVVEVTGERWYFQSQPNLSQRQVYNFTAAGNIAHGINWNSVYSISPRSYGSYTNGTNEFGVIFGSSVAIAGQVSFYVTSTNIVVLSGAGAPAISSGFIVLEWITNI